MSEKKPSLLFRMIRGILLLVYPKMEVEGLENLPQEPCVIVANHCQLHGPIAGELYFPGDRAIWCAGQMMHLKDVPGYAFQDFWSQKPKYTHWFYRIASYLIAPLSVCIFNNAHTIGVYHDSRIIGTFKNTVRMLCSGANILIFPEHDVKYNHIVYEFQEKFIDVARLYYKKTGKELSFVPMYIAPKLHKMVLGQPIRFCAGEDMDTQRRRIRDYLMQSVTTTAEALPEHTVIPYRNIPKRLYPTNIPKEETHEKTCG